MAHAILMPRAGQSMTEGRIISWLKKEGEPVAKGDPILEIETDKANLEVEADEAGVLRKVFHGPGEVVPVLAVVGVIGGRDEAIDFAAMKALGAPAEASEGPGAAGAPALPAASSPTSAARSLTGSASTTSRAPPATAPARSTAAPAVHLTQGVPQNGAPGASARSSSSSLASPPHPAGDGHGRVFASPLARNVARERGVDLALLSGSGPGGRILRRDVDFAAEHPPARPSPSGGPRSAPLRAYPPPSARPAPVVPFTGMRKAIASALLQSKQSIPHFYATATIDVTGALELKRAREALGVKVSVNDLILRATTLALIDEPKMSCRVFPDRIEYPQDIHLGLAVGGEDGLVVPVLLRAQTLSLEGLAAEARRIIQAAGAGKLVGSGQGTFTISNLGMLGVESFSAIINPPEGAILAVGAAQAQLVPFEGGFAARSLLKVTLSCDHRAIDGWIAGRFLQRLKHILEAADRL